eukprot:m.24243 g.24243  ORF g.24243 m.24243 type:complete len:67 (-) comp9091_c0_seq1:1456-1656(-)
MFKWDLSSFMYLFIRFYTITFICTTCWCWCRIGEDGASSCVCVLGCALADHPHSPQAHHGSLSRGT